MGVTTVLLNSRRGSSGSHAGGAVTAWAGESDRVGREVLGEDAGVPELRLVPGHHDGAVGWEIAFPAEQLGLCVMRGSGVRRDGSPRPQRVIDE